jgi:hypothetical protein
MSRGELKLIGRLVSIVLIIVCVPAGMMWVTSTKERSIEKELAGPPPKMGHAPTTKTLEDRERKRQDAQDTAAGMFEAALGLTLVHLVMSSWGFLKPQSYILGLRGTVIGVLCWSAFGVGIILGIWPSRNL